MAKLTVTALQQMKRDGQKIMAAVCYDYQLSSILDRAGVDLISAGDSVGYTNFGQLTLHAGRQQVIMRSAGKVTEALIDLRSIKLVPAGR